MDAPLSDRPSMGRLRWRLKELGTAMEPNAAELDETRSAGPDELDVQERVTLGHAERGRINVDAFPTLPDPSLTCPRFFVEVGGCCVNRMSLLNALRRLIPA